MAANKPETDPDDRPDEITTDENENEIAEDVQAGRLEIVYRPLSKLLPYARNARTHSEDQINKIVASMQEFGWTQPMLVSDNGDGSAMILAGHGRQTAGFKAGFHECPTIDLSHLDEMKQRAYVIADNRLAELAGWHDETLAVEFEDFNAEGYNIEQTGFDMDAAEEIMKAARSKKGEADGAGGQKGEDEFGEVQQNPVARLGDLWQLGGHRLICADSMAGQTFEDLVGDDSVHMIATDPPYAIYGSATGIASDISDDKMVRPFFDKVLTIAKDRLEWFGHCYMFCDWRSWPAIWEAGKGVPHVEPKNLLVWDKGGAGLGSNYANTYECCAFFAKLPKQTAMGNRPSGQRPVHKPNVLRHNRPSGDDRMHNAAKPVALMRELIENSSGPGDVVLEPFAGSGTTIIAADQTDRICLAVEIDPGWMDVILQRFWDLRELEPVLTHSAGDEAEQGLTLSEVRDRRAG